jgi:NitT/TauT family transport system permease protein
MKRQLANLWPFLLVILAWQVWIVAKDIQPIVAPAPAAVFQQLVSSPLAYLRDAGLTLKVAAAGLLIGLLLGIGLASLTWISPLFNGVVSPAVLLTQTVPVIVMIPVIARLLGYNERTIIAVAALIAFFPAFVLANAGLRATPAGSDDLFAVLGAKRSTRFFRLAMPSAVPSICTALRISAVLAVVGALIGEWLLGTNGIGYRLALSQINLQPGDSWAASLVAIVISLVAFGAATVLERWSRARFT